MFDNLDHSPELTTQRDSDAFDPEWLSADMRTVQRIYTAFFAHLPVESWERSDHHGGWTLRQVLLHLTLINELYRQAIQAALHGRCYELAGLQQRQQLAGWNQQQLLTQDHISNFELRTRLLASFECSAREVERIAPEQLQLQLQLPLLQHPASLAELYGAQIVHAGLTHAAQVAECAETIPLWEALMPDERQRLLTRQVHVLAHNPAPAHGEAHVMRLSLEVAGWGGGFWWLEIGPDCSSGQAGHLSQPDCSLSFRDTDTLFRLLTRRLNLPTALLRGDLQFHGNLRQCARGLALLSTNC